MKNDDGGIVESNRLSEGLRLDKSKYFFRTAVFTLQEDQLALVDVHEPDVTTKLDPWLGKVVSLADGQHTIQELIDYLESQYHGGPPKELESTIESVIGRLTEAEVVRLTDDPITLPYYLALPIEEQDEEKAKELMIKDGYIKH